MSLHKKVQEVFSLNSQSFYLRNEILENIKSFLEDKKDFILHLTGNPGSGKTSITKFVCKNKKYIYLNAYTDEIKKKILANKKCKLFIIDEFDKIPDSKFVINFIKSNKMKLITLSNNLNKSSGLNISLPTYTSRDILEILNLKCQEINSEILSDDDKKIISKMFGRTGDMRLVFNFVRDNFDKKINKVSLPKKAVDQESTSDQNLHHRLIKEVQGDTQERRKAYSLYIEKCDKLGITSFYRNDFYSVYDLYN
ncbi:cell division control protein 6 like protein [Vairimorpha necatrix]|uniref:Cell division control protein 6 like protein n=1 Tax=Vairimorpha necatrix TaxID=6039 RepID=A0AAX4JA53_9MICR